MATDIGDRLRDLRDAMGWTQDDLAREVGRRSNAVSEWERGARKPPKSVLTRLADDHGWPVAMFQVGGPMPHDVVNRPLTAQAVREPTVPPYPVSRAEWAYLEAKREVMRYEERGELVPPRVALRLLWEVSIAEATPPAAGDRFDRAGAKGRGRLAPGEPGSEDKAG